MPVDLVPLPVRRDLEVPTSDDPAELKRFLKDLVKDYNTLYGILRQDVNRLSTPVRAGRDVGAELDEQGYALALLWAWTGNAPNDSQSWPPQPRFIPSKIRAFLSKWSFG